MNMRCEMTIGQAIKKARERKGYTAQKLAEEAGIGVSTIEFWESDRTSPNIVTLILVADVLDVTLDELAGRSRQ